MKSRKIKVFLTGVVNSTNAQNLNCRALMKYLDPEKFEVRALTVYSGNLPLPSGITSKAFYLIRYPAKIWYVIQLVRGILWSDVAYLCKPEHWKLQRFVCRVFRKRTLGTVENIYIGMAVDRAVSRFGSVAELCAFHTFMTKTYAITSGMGEMNTASVGLPKPAGVLYLGTECAQFADAQPKTKLTDAILIGADLKRKGIDEYLELARRFPAIVFHVVGGDVGEIDYRAMCAAAGLRNVVFHGSLLHDELARLFRSIQLHVFPSKAEGFGKVTFETAAAGLPSIVYGCYGAREWIDSWHNGVVVDSFEEMVSAVQRLVENSDLLRVLSANARKLAEVWDWKSKIGPWERAIEDVFDGPPPRRMDAWLDVCEVSRKFAWVFIGIMRSFLWMKYDYYHSAGSGDYSDPQFCRLTTWEAFREFMLARGRALYGWQIRRFDEDHASFVCLADKTSLWVSGWEVNDEGDRRLYDFVTVPEERRKGYYTRLLRHLRAEGECMIYVRPSNAPSVKVIERAGFVKFASRFVNCRRAEKVE